MLGAGTAAVYMLPWTVSLDRLAPWFRMANRVEPEAWPICTTMSSVVDDADWVQLDPDFAAGKRALAAGDWYGAISALKLAALRDPRNADLQNYIGYAYRRSRQLEPAVAHYRLALAFNPSHRAAHEHLGEAYLAKGQLQEAEAHLAALRDICLISCEEYGDLERTIAAYKNSAIH
jgi:tetratricopeptide (TPR) repeat protein